MQVRSVAFVMLSFAGDIVVLEHCIGWCLLVTVVVNEMVPQPLCGGFCSALLLMTPGQSA